VPEPGRNAFIEVAFKFNSKETGFTTVHMYVCVCVCGVKNSN
jgi:hypothetical protein